MNRSYRGGKAAMAVVEEVVCPFCALACDDLAVEAAADGTLRVVKTDCPIARHEFARPAAAAGPLVSGAPAGLDEALARAAALLAGSRLPLFAGLGTDVAGMRAVLALAERTGGIVDHWATRGLMANLRAMQDGGWVTTTLAEVRNRADLVLLVGTDGRATAPRFVERCLTPAATLFGPLARNLVYLGEGLEAPAGIGAAVAHIPCPPERLPEAVAILRALVAGHGIGAGIPPGLDLAALAELAERLRAARYPVIVWAAHELPGRHPDLAVGSLAALTRELNAKGRAAGLPLAGPDNVIGCNQVCGWQAGVPLRTSFAAGVPDHDPRRWNAERLLAAGSVDRLVWIASLRDAPPPLTDVPTVALVRPGNALPQAAEVVIPVGAPGLDHEGVVYRTDGVVSLPVRRLRDGGLPSAAEILRAISAALPP